MKTFEEKMQIMVEYIVLRCKDLNKNLEWCNSLVYHYTDNDTEEKIFLKLILQEYNKANN